MLSAPDQKTRCDTPPAHEAEQRVPQDAVTACKKCGNHVHRDCFQRWCTAKRAQQVPVSCVYCRAAWEDESSGAPGSSSSYLNLAQHSRHHRGSDLSLQSLYGDRSLFIRAGQGSLSRAEAVRQFTMA